MARILTGPQCKFSFDITYGRAFACQGCESAIISGCDLAKCPKCGMEFLMK